MEKIEKAITVKDSEENLYFCDLCEKKSNELLEKSDELRGLLINLEWKREGQRRWSRLTLNCPLAEMRGKVWYEKTQGENSGNPCRLSC